jgi:hypothetical protein
MRATRLEPYDRGRSLAIGDVDQGFACVHAIAAHSLSRLSDLSYWVSPRPGEQIVIAGLARQCIFFAKMDRC